MTTKALVVLSGGQDSTTCLFWAKKYFDEVYTITFKYGQLHSREIQAAEDVSDICGVAGRELVNLGEGILASTSPLVDRSVSLETYTDHDTMAEVIGDRVEKTFVPMRNALFLTIAANRAVALGCTHIVTGVCQEDNANYPDCRRTFIDSQQETISRALGQKISIATPLMSLSKAGTVQLAQHLGDEAFAALAWSHTAYDGHYPPTGHDHASLLRAHGFEQAGVPDPLVVRAVREGLMDLPRTINYQDIKLVEHVWSLITAAAVKLEA